MHDTLVRHPYLLDAFDAAIALYDRHTAQHCARVSRVASSVGIALGIGAQELEALACAGFLHDLGKLGVSSEILRKRGPLDCDEWDEIKRHPLIGADIILSISELLEPIAGGIRSHHERWDGTGYPDGLRGEAIPLVGRIIAVADVFDAMTSPRPYRHAEWSETEVINHLQMRAGLHCDPEIVRVFVGLHEQNANP